MHLVILTIIINVTFISIFSWWKGSEPIGLYFWIWVFICLIILLVAIVTLYFGIFQRYINITRRDFSNEEDSEIFSSAQIGPPLIIRDEKWISKCSECKSDSFSYNRSHPFDILGRRRSRIPYPGSSQLRRIKSLRDWWDNELVFECNSCNFKFRYEANEIKGQITKNEVLVTIVINIILIISLLNWSSAGRKADIYDDICGDYTLDKVIDYGLVEPYPKKAFRSDNETNINEQHKILKDIIQICEK